MHTYGQYRSDNDFEKVVAQMYLYFLPFQMFVPFAFLNSIFVGLARRASFLFLAIGLILIAGSGRRISFSNDESSRLLLHFVKMYIVGDITSLIMAVWLYYDMGTIGGESTLSAVLPKIAFSIAYMFILYYNRELFRVLTKDEIKKIFDRIITICIAIGVLQIGVLYVGGLFRVVYDRINMLFGAWSSTSIVRTERIALFTIEPATIAGFFGILVIPHIFSKWIADDVNLKDVIKLILIIIVLYFTRSTTGYSLLAVDFLLFGYVYIRKGTANIGTRVFIIAFMIFSLFLLGNIVIRNKLIAGNLSFVFDKLFNSDNLASMSRKVGLYVNWGIVKKFPILGVGNGNQGFFYQEFFPKSAFSSVWATQRYNEASTVLLDGGVFFPSFASGYGIVGIVFLLIFAVMSRQIMRKYREYYGYLYYFYIIGSIALLIYGFSSTMVGDYSVWFIISLPMAIYYWKDDSQVLEAKNRGDLVG